MDMRQINQLHPTILTRGALKIDVWKCDLLKLTNWCLQYNLLSLDAFQTAVLVKIYNNNNNNKALKGIWS